MVVYLSAANCSILPDITDKRKEQFNARWTTSALADASYIGYWPEAMTHGGLTKTIEVTHFAMSVFNQSGNVIVFGSPKLAYPKEDATLAYTLVLPPWSTGITAYDARITEVDFPFKWASWMNSATMYAWAIGDISGYGPADGLTVTLWGELLWEPDGMTEAPMPSPVSLEGYKWPLVRR